MLRSPIAATALLILACGCGSHGPVLETENSRSPAPQLSTDNQDARSPELAEGLVLTGESPAEDPGVSPSDDAIDEADAGRTVPGVAPIAIAPPPGEWTWLPVAGTRCLDGSETGVGLNVQDPSQPLVIYLDAGGACIDAFTCSRSGITSHFGPDDFDTRQLELDQSGLFDRDDNRNPLGLMNWAFIPYCTGDVHSGTRADNEGGLNFSGGSNVQQVLEVLAPNFSEASSVFLTGASAGGFGTFFNFERVRNAFTNRSVHVINDSGPLLDSTWMSPTFQSLTFSTWQAATPATCDVGPGSVFGMYDCLSALSPNSRFAILTSTRDSVNRQFLRDSLLSPATTEEDYAAGVLDLVGQLSSKPQWALFVEEGTEHVFGDSPLSQTVLPSPVDTSLSDFIRGVASGQGFATVLDPTIQAAE